MTRRELLSIATGMVAAAVAAAMPPVKYPITQPVTTDILHEHLAYPTEGDVLQLICDGKEWHIV